MEYGKYQSAVWFLPQDDDPDDAGLPLVLQCVTSRPILPWTCAELKARGIGRIFLVAPETQHALLRPHVPEGAELLRCAPDGMERLRALLAEQDASAPVLILCGAAVPVATEGEAPVFAAGAADALALCAALCAGREPCRPEGAEDAPEFGAVADGKELLDLAQTLSEKALAGALAGGVRIYDPGTTYLDPGVVIGAGTVLLPGTILRGNTRIGRNCVIGPNAMLTDCIVGENTEVNASQATESRIGSHTTVGPFAYLRPNSTVGDHVKVGDFVEIKNSVIGDGTKISHLTYVGDSDVGERVNFGCGTVTTNYDGFRKYRCTIEDDAFIGCNTNLIAPVTVGAGSYIAAGSTITDDVPADSLALARAKQTVKEQWAARRRRLLGK